MENSDELEEETQTVVLLEYQVAINYFFVKLIVALNTCSSQEMLADVVE
jgi:hypothetical protein